VRRRLALWSRPSLVFMAFIALTAAPVGAIDERRARLGATVNDIRYKDIDVLLTGTDILVLAGDLEGAGLGAFAHNRDSNSYVSLSSLGPRLQFRLDGEHLLLHLTVDLPGSEMARPSTITDTRWMAEKLADRSNIANAPTPHREPMLVPSGELRALLKLQINQVYRGTIAVLLRGDDVLVHHEDILSPGIGPVTQIEIIRGQGYVSLKSLAPTVSFDLADTDLSLRLSIAPQKGKTQAPVTTENIKQPENQTKLSATETVSKEPQEALLDLWVNEIAKSEVRVLIAAQDVLARLKDIETIGFTDIGGTRQVVDNEIYVSLNSLAPKIRYKVSEKDLRLLLTVEPTAFGLTSIDFYKNRPAEIEYRADPSSFFNYSFNVQNFKRFSAFSEAGVNVNNILLYSGLSRNLDGTIVRGLSNLTISNRNNLIRTVLGDRLINSDALGGSIILGGVSFFREFGLDPYFSRNPGLNYSGSVTTPSTLDVLVNGLLVRRVQLPPGPFDVRNLPVPTGSADTRFVLRDAFGRVQESSSPFYFTSGLLKEGLHEFSYNIGVRRDDLDSRSWDYGAPIFLGRHRFGLTNWLTTGLRLEASRDLVSGGPTLSVLLPFGEVEVTTALSHDHGLTGAGAFIGYGYSGVNFSLGSSARLLSHHYANASLDASGKRSRLQIDSFVGIPISSRMSLSLRHIFENKQVEGIRQEVGVSTSYRLLDGLQLYLRGGYQRQNSSNAPVFFTGLNYVLKDTSITAAHSSVDGVNTSTLALQKPLPIGTGIGYQLQANFGSDRLGADNFLQYQGPFGRYEIFHHYQNGQNSETLQASGGIAYLGGTLIATRAVQESFALIQVPGLAGVRGYMNNLEIGASDANGNLFAPDILPYYGNRLSVSDKDIPFNYIVDRVERTVAPPYRGGAVIRFPIRRVQRITGAIILDGSTGEMIPKHGQLSLRANGKQFESPLGKEGEFYLENLEPGSYPAELEFQDQTCQFNLTIPTSNEAEIELGRVRCRI
jgi:outer membrane usher protein